MGFLLNLIGAVADNYSRGGGAVSWFGQWEGAQKRLWSNDDGRWAPPINREHSDWPQQKWPGQ